MSKCYCCRKSFKDYSNIYMCVDPFEPESGYKIQRVCSDCLKILGMPLEKQEFNINGEYLENKYDGKTTKTEGGRLWYRFLIDEIYLETIKNPDEEWTWKDSNNLLNYREKKNN
jgi:hypothetical protein